MSDIEAATQLALQSIQASTALDELDQLRVNLLGKSGSITSQLKQLGALPPEQRKLAGEAVNRAKEQLAEAIAEP